MPNITLSIDDELLRSGREYAKSHGETLNGLVRKLLTQAVLDAGTHWVEECFALMGRGDLSALARPSSHRLQIPRSTPSHGVDGGGLARYPDFKGRFWQKATREFTAHHLERIGEARQWLLTLIEG